MSRLSLYWNTVRYMKPSQVCYRLRKMAGLSCTLGCRVEPFSPEDRACPIASPEALDFDPVFLQRFPTEELLQNHVTFLHEGETVDWQGTWDFPGRSPLWNFNLHYFEYLLPLAAGYRKNGDPACLAKLRQCILGWIRANPRSSGGTGWAAYPIALRLTNWLSVYTWLEDAFRQDGELQREFLQSVHDQYDHLSRHLEKDLLGNHYFEDLKALVLCALFFGDGRVLDRALGLLTEQCREQILPDGMHFELSPMYHKLILEDVLRVAFALRGAGKPSRELEAFLQPMLDAAFSLEQGLRRLPLFNDCGTNVSKSLEALCRAADQGFGLKPRRKLQLPDAGYYILEAGDLRLIVDAGRPGPDYLPGHAHCDCMSFELFRRGEPVLVNCGTYAYQCRERLWFKSTAAHNTVMVEGTEQSRCWGAFRMAERSSVRVTDLTGGSIAMEMTDAAGHRITRELILTVDSLRIRDHCPGQKLVSFCHTLEPVTLDTAAHPDPLRCPYAPEFGAKGEISGYQVSAVDGIDLTVHLQERK